ncbi:hypothetical protein D1AOALGA4SA_9954 [Olavius algarvensis Delta 1 endosymbiont]|nr:hypothetical protein D1AOALGA4SA_9954 [Olavius algarvensis Delta 1 endosymbiont]
MILNLFQKFTPKLIFVNAFILKVYKENENYFALFCVKLN